MHKDGVVTPYTYGENNEMLTAGSETWTWDHFGNAKTKVVSGNTTTFGWDFESHLLSIDYPGTANDDSHEYDGNHLRMRSKLAGAANWTNFVWDELTNELLAEYTLISGTFTIKALNTYGLGLISSNREGVKRYFHFDPLGNTAALDDENENLKDSYTYESFGVVVTATSTNGASVNPFRFVGQWGYYDDSVMGSQGDLALLGVRYLNPRLGRFCSWDSLYADNAYIYCNNAALTCVDPSGTFGIQIGAGPGAIIGVGSGVEHGDKPPRFECSRKIPKIPWLIDWATGPFTKPAVKQKYCTTCQALCLNWCEDMEGTPGLDLEACIRQCRLRFAECMAANRWPPRY